MCSEGRARVAAGGRVWEPEPVTGALLAHQGGWDEVLMVLVPIALFAGLLVMANRRANAIESQRDRGDGPTGTDGRNNGAARPDLPDRHRDGPTAR